MPTISVTNALNTDVLIPIQASFTDLLVAPAQQITNFLVNDTDVPLLTVVLDEVVARYGTSFSYVVGSDGIESLVEGPGITVNTTSPANPIISIAGMDVPYTCDPSVQVNDVVGHLGSAVLMPALAVQPFEGQVIGIVISKQSSTACVVRILGPVGGFTGLTPGIQYYLSALTAGAITSTLYSTPGQIVYRVGFAKDSITLLWILDQDPIEL